MRLDVLKGQQRTFGLGLVENKETMPYLIAFAMM